MNPQDSARHNRARQLRHEQTEAERRLWAQLRHRRLGGVKFRRQHPIGYFIVDFCCPEHSLVVELDGGQHVTQVESEQKRTVFLERSSYRTRRFWNHEVIENIEAVMLQIVQALRDPHPNPLPRREREWKKR